jgi:broad specificity phosphatase PhoE
MTAPVIAVQHVYLIRHAETAWSLTGQHTGVTDIPLTEHGEDEARALSPLLKDIHFAAVLTSPRQRARRTCALAGLESNTESDQNLTEWDYGDYEGQRTAEIRKGRPNWNVYRDGCPHGETPAQASDRADRLIAHLNSIDGNVALFSHGQFGCVLAARWTGLTVLEAQHFILGPATMSILSYNPNHPDVPVIALWNATPALITPTN